MADVLRPGDAISPGQRALTEHRSDDARATEDSYDDPRPDDTSTCPDCTSTDGTHLDVGLPDVTALLLPSQLDDHLATQGMIQLSTGVLGSVLGEEGLVHVLGPAEVAPPEFVLASDEGNGNLKKPGPDEKCKPNALKKTHNLLVVILGPGGKFDLSKFRVPKPKYGPGSKDKKDKRRVRTAFPSKHKKAGLILRVEWKYTWTQERKCEKPPPPSVDDPYETIFELLVYKMPSVRGKWAEHLMESLRSLSADAEKALLFAGEMQHANGVPWADIAGTGQFSTVGPRGPYESNMVCWSCLSSGAAVQYAYHFPSDAYAPGEGYWDQTRMMSEMLSGGAEAGVKAWNDFQESLLAPRKKIGGKYYDIKKLRKPKKKKNSPPPKKGK